MLSHDELDQLTDAIWGKLVGESVDISELALKAQLTLEQKLNASPISPYGLDRLNTEQTAAYLGVQAETLRDRAKRGALGLPSPFKYARKLFWRRSELEAWIERQREATP
jgi:predicted DNA-binding transcriptional regulator AlpA